MPGVEILDGSRIDKYQTAVIAMLAQPSRIDDQLCFALGAGGFSLIQIASCSPRLYLSIPTASLIERNPPLRSKSASPDFILATRPGPS